MRRRHFFGAVAAASVFSAQTPSRAQSNRAKFKLRYGPHPGMFRNAAGPDIIDQIKFSADQGFTGWEDNGAMGREPALQEKIGKALADSGMKMGVFVSFSDFNGSDFVTKTDKAYQETLKAKMRDAVECAKRLQAKWTTVVPASVNNRLDPYFQTANCITNLKAMCEVCEPAGLVMVLEPLNWYANHPGLFLRSVPQAYMICKGVGSKSCKILDDLYHQQIDVGNLIPNMQKAWDEIDYIQVGDNPGRKEPTTGEINYKKIFQWLHEKKFGGVVGMEHGNAKPGKDGEMAVIAAYRECDSF
ncbi:MAG: TIM barrel protein [Bryobacterales bacterium]|nr:TIM barrel protein [Bryobacterales bacterium]